MKASKIKAEEFMDENPFTVDGDSSIASVRDSMEERNLRAVAVERDGQLEGAVSYRDLIRHVQFNPDTTKLEKIVHNPPNFEPEDTVLELCDLRINSGKKLLTCTDPDENLEAVFSDEEFRKALQKVDEVQKISSRDVASFEVVKAFESDSVEKVRHQMLDNNISRIPVLDEDGKLVGVLRSTDVLKLLVPREGQSSGGTSGNSLKDTQIAGGNEKERLSSINVSEVMNRTPTTSQKHISGEKALELMDDRDSHEVLIVDDKYPEAVVTGKDFIKHVAELKASDTVLVNLVGLDVDEEKAAVHEKIETQ
ncbi:MAG: CBS domain-containing protein, partial [Candidatus Nanohalobium sp.]